MTISFSIGVCKKCNETHRLDLSCKVEQCFCQSYYDLYDQLQNCTCGKCLIKDIDRLYKSSPIKELSEHDQELIREGKSMSDFDTRRGE